MKPETWNKTRYFYDTRRWEACILYVVEFVTVNCICDTVTASSTAVKM